MDATRELPRGKFDVVVVTGSTEVLDQRFIDVLDAGGRLFMIVGKPPVMEARLVRLSGENDWTSETLFETSLAPLVNGKLPPQFSF